MNQANPISSFGNSFSTGFWSGGDWRWRWEGRRGWGTDMDHSWNSAVYPEFRGHQPYKEQKLRKRLYMPISYSSLTVVNWCLVFALFNVPTFCLSVGNYSISNFKWNREFSLLLVREIEKISLPLLRIPILLFFLPFFL